MNKRLYKMAVKKNTGAIYETEIPKLACMDSDRIVSRSNKRSIPTDKLQEKSAIS